MLLVRSGFVIGAIVSDPSPCLSTNTGSHLGSTSAHPTCLLEMLVLLTVSFWSLAGRFLDSRDRWLWLGTKDTGLGPGGTL